jgi:hypothetical protein
VAALAAALGLAAVALPGVSHGRPSVSPEVERFLAETVFDHPPSRAAKDAFRVQLSRRGIETVTDLLPYLELSERVRMNTLLVMGHIGRLDAKAVGRLTALVEKSPASAEPSYALALRLALDHTRRSQAAALATTVVGRLRFDPLAALVAWLVEQDGAWLASAEEAELLARACLRRLESLFADGRYSGRWPLRFSLLVDRPPFTAPTYAPAVSRAFLAALANTSRTADLRELAFIGAFTAVVRTIGADGAGAEALLYVADQAPRPLAKLMLWRLVAEGLDESPAGRRIVDAVVSSFPELGAFVELAREARHSRSGGRLSLAEEISSAFEQLEGPAGRRL